MTHEIIADLKHRYMTKKYDSTKAISPQALAVFLEALRLLTSSINSQPWKFIVLESDESKQRFFNSFEDHFLFNQVHAKTASHIILFANKIIYTEQDYEAVIEKSIADQHLSAEKNRMLLQHLIF
ncbi:MAG: Major NAD(P)H-flavin oxidoreductase [Candidatus Celerinatantimonas neptuna]|nr:MAG: Major NAD(P)H-flavin oxidoreductase [Candidatus Celerinatantimonas neptuna]